MVQIRVNHFYRLRARPCARPQPVKIILRKMKHVEMADRRDLQPLNHAYILGRQPFSIRASHKHKG